MSGLKCETLLKTDEGTSIEDDKSSKKLLNTRVYEHQGTLTTCKTTVSRDYIIIITLYYSIYKVICDLGFNT